MLIILRFQDPACQNINPQHQCFAAQPSCRQNDNNSTDDVSRDNIIVITLATTMPIVLIGVVLILVIVLKRKRKKGRRGMYIQRDPYLIICI